MEYKIEKIKNTSEKFKGIQGMKVLTYIPADTKIKHIDGPLNLNDYDKYYEWLFKYSKQLGISSSKNFSDFKSEYMTYLGEMLPHIEDLNDLEILQGATENDIHRYNVIFNEYFKDVKYTWPLIQ